MDKTQKLDLLLAAYIACIVAAELLGSKIFQFSLSKLPSAFLSCRLPLPSTILLPSLSPRKSFIRSSLFILIGLALYNLLALILPPAKRFLESNDAYNLIFAKSLRITLASLTAFFLSERLDVYVFSKIREKLGTKNLWLRNNLSNFIGQLFDTTTFMLLAFFTPGNFSFVLSLIWPYWLLKCFMSVIETPFTYLGVRWLKK